MGNVSWSRACTLFLACATTAAALCAQDSAPILTTLHSFDIIDGAYPDAAPIQATDGNLYGTTSDGGVSVACGNLGCGTVFKITPSGALTTLYSFCSQNGCTDGQYPVAGLVQASNGNLYGTTWLGGLNSCTIRGTPSSCGTIFKISPNGMLTTVHSFCSQSGCTDGANPQAGLVQGTDGNLYGITEFGGSKSCTLSGFSYGCGTVFKITPGGTLTTVYNFCSQSNCADGEFPVAALVQGSDGNFYGTTDQGGANLVGTVFRITSGGALTTLYSFCSQYDCTDGSTPTAELVQAADRSFYGTTDYGGAANPYCSFGCGTVFKITSSGALTTLYSFCSQTSCTDGEYPLAALVQATDGNFYGTASGGGTYLGDGTIFKITPGGALTTLYSFCSQNNCADGFVPQAALIQDTNGNFYGTTYFGGGSDRYGTVFSLSVGLGPFVEPAPSSAKVGAAVKILGTSLTGSTRVTFNGTAATFKVVSSSLITTNVPAGATSGKIQVTTPTRTLSSNVSFRVLP